MYRKTIIDIFQNVWPMLIIVMTIVITMRITSIIMNKEKVCFYKDVLALMFMIYVICLFYVVTFQDVSWSTSNFIPFKEMFRYRVFSYMFFKNVVGNMIMFLPYGFFVSYFLNLKKPSVMLVLSILVSVTIETTQLIIGRVFDVDDILINVIGAMLGFGFYNFLHFLEAHLPHFLKKVWIYNIIISVFFIVGVLLIAKILIGV